MPRTKGLWEHDQFAQTVSEYVGSGYNQDATPFAQFCHASAKIIQMRRARHATSLATAPTVFILSPVPINEELKPDLQPMFDRGLIEIAGSIWFGTHRLGQATGITLPDGDDLELFRYICETLNVGSKPTIYYDARNEPSIMRAYPNGFSDPDRYEALSLESANLTLEHIQKTLNEAHSRFLVTPTASDLARDLWEDQGKSFPIREAEKGIQKVLHIALTSGLGFGSIFVKQEETSAMGRYDFCLQEQDPIDPSQWTHHAILELKVVKTHTHSGSQVADSVNKQAITEGVTQADKYRSDHACRLAALCCYDMRKEPEPNEAVQHEQQRATSLQVALWAWPLYSTAKRARSA